MAYIPLAPLPLQFQDTVTSVNMSGGTIEFFLAGTSTPVNLFSDDIGTSIGTSITLNAGGMPESGGNVITLFRDDSVAYKLVLKNAAGSEISTSNPIPKTVVAPYYEIIAAETTAGLVESNLNTEKPPLNVLRYGTNTTPGTTDMTTAIQAAIDVTEVLGGGIVTIPLGTYRITSALTVDTTNLTYAPILQGEGSNTTGTVISNVDNDVISLYINGDISDQSTKRIDRCVIKDIRFNHEAATKYAIVAEEAPYVFGDRIKVECNDAGFGAVFLGSTSVTPDSDNFLSSFEDCDFRNFTDVGVRVNSKGHTFKFINCKVGGGGAGAYDGWFNTEGVEIDGGQWGGSPNGVHWDNQGAGDIEFGKMSGVKFEGVGSGEVGVKITGTNATPRDFQGIVLENLATNMNAMDGTLVEFDYARQCKLIYPTLNNPTLGSGVLANWTANSDQCELLCDYVSAQAALTVHASATRATKRVTGQISRSQVTNITTYANLTTTLADGVDDLPPGFLPVHNGTAWNFQMLTLADDIATSFTPPADRGMLELYTNGALTFWGEVYYDADSGTADCDLKHSGGDLEAATGVLSNGGGTDVKVTVSAHTDGLLYVSNRSGGTLKFTILMKPNVWL